MTFSKTKQHYHDSTNTMLPPFSLTKRDMQILQAISDCSALTAPQISLLLFPPATSNGHVTTHSRCRYRLKLLTAHGYLIRVVQPHLITDGKKPYVYLLSKRGAQLLAQWRSLPLNMFPYKQAEDTRFNGIFLAHLVLTNTVRVALTKAVAQSNDAVALIHWIDEQTLRKYHSQEPLELPGAHGRIYRRVLVPDGYFLLRTHHPEVHDFHHFVELDRGSEIGMSTTAKHRDWQRKIQMYLLYYQSGAFQKRYGGHGMRVLTVTTSDTRLNLLKQVTEAAGGKTRFLFTTVSALTSVDIAQLLTTPIWQAASTDTVYPLLW
jgi:hypothetical protein